MEMLKDSNQEIEFDPKTMSFKDKIIWTFRLWFGFKQRLKVKVKLI